MTKEQIKAKFLDEKIENVSFYENFISLNKTVKLNYLIIIEVQFSETAIRFLFRKRKHLTFQQIIFNKVTHEVEIEFI